MDNQLEKMLLAGIIAGTVSIIAVQRHEIRELKSEINELKSGYKENPSTNQLHISYSPQAQERIERAKAAMSYAEKLNIQQATQ